MSCPGGDPSTAARKPASTFAMTCSLLSQYLKERKGSGFGDLGLGIVSRDQDSASRGKSETTRAPPTTLSLLPGIAVAEAEKGERGNGESRGNAIDSVDLGLFPRSAGFGTSSPAPTQETREPKAQLTMFYGGKVLVFDNFPADKARDLMQLASKDCAASKTQSFATPVNAVDDCRKAVSPPATGVPAAAPPPKLPQAGGSDMPIARRASLHRFLEKRKDRISTKAPYQLNGGGDAPAPAANKPEESKEWLGLSPESSSR